ncbi:protein kinase domain-containing protein [Kitasatospora sp. KL5]|uniref:protein kinase domain-containing protein n=1 Tax=Kitasatospora sp. KL5 TaxID=3425125 RepID=UPI003D6E6D69
MGVGKSGNAHAAEPIGSVGQGRYVLEAPLGEGGMGSVYRARDTLLDRTVAVKTLHSDLARDPSFRERFRREAQGVAGLSHANIVAVHDTGEDTGADGTVQFIVMEYVSGRSVRELVRERAAGPAPGTVPLDRALAVTAAVLDALDHSHRQGLVHRDIKPANVMTADDGTVKVMDFGIARALQSDATAMTRTGTVLGTPQYLSPEQAQGKPADARSDLYSVGCMLFELATGTVPFDGESTMSVLYQHVQQAPPVPSSLNPSLPPGVDAVVARALAKDPAERYRSARAMADDVRRLADGRSATMVDRPHSLHSAATVAAEGVGAVTDVEGSADARPAGGTGTHGGADSGAGADPAGGAPHGGGTRTAGGSRARTDAADAWAADAFTAGVRLTSGMLQAHSRQVRRSLKVAGWASLPVAVLVLAAGVLGTQYLLPDFTSHSTRTADPRATGAFLGCDPYVSRDGTFDPPSFTGMSAAEAQTCAEIAGLKVDRKTVSGTKSNKDTVTRQEPETTKSVKRGETVTVWVSQGGDPRAKGELSVCETEERHGKVPTPWLKGRTASTAKVCAEIAHLVFVEAGRVQDPFTPAGQVSRQEPESEDIAVGGTVKVWISTGGDPRAVGELSGCDRSTGERPEAPQLQYKTVEAARACAEIGGLKLEEHHVPDAIWPRGEVVKQEPDSVTRIDPGSTVKIWVSTGAP